MTIPSFKSLWPGLLLCVAVSAAALLLQSAEVAVVGHPYLEALVLAILIGVVVRTAWRLPARCTPGIGFSAKFLLEVAVMLLGASLSVQALAAVGPGLILGIAGVVVVAILVSYGASRALGLSPRVAALVACGNSICGNSAIAAVAPVIGADKDEVASSIAFTAVLGVVVVLALPLLFVPLGLSGAQYGVLAGLTVYAVPQVLAATVPVGVLATQVGTVVKLVRVLMLGPVVVALSIGASRQQAAAGGTAQPVRKTGILRWVPWFILGFLVLAVLRSLGLVPQALLQPIAALTGALTVIAMAALGLGVDLRMLARSGGRVVAAATLSILLLGVVSLGLIHLLRIG